MLKALENDSKVEEKISPLEKIYNESTIVSKSNELRAELEKNYKIIDVEADGNCFSEQFYTVLEDQISNTRI